MVASVKPSTTPGRRGSTGLTSEEAAATRAHADTGQAEACPTLVRMTRLTNAFSKKIENHVAAIALH